MSSRPPSVDTNHETLPFNPSETDVVGFEGKTRELAVVIKKQLVEDVAGVVAAGVEEVEVEADHVAWQV